MSAHTNQESVSSRRAHITVSVTCEWSFQQRSGKHGIKNLYLKPKEVVRTEDKKTVAEGNAVSLLVSDELHSPATYPLEHGRASVIAHFFDNWLQGYHGSTAAFLVPEERGYVAHSDFMVFRLARCALVSSVQSFLAPLAKIQPFTGLVHDTQDVANALNASIGALVSPSSPAEDHIPQLEHELEQRLSLPWCVPVQPSERRICVVLPQTSTTVTKDRWETAAALGVKVVVLSSGCWWINGSQPHEHLRESFISIDTTADAGLWRRIFDAVESYPHRVDGIFTITDDYLVSVAKAAEKLGLFTPGPEPYSIATDKYLTRQCIEPDSSEYFTVSSLCELELRMNLGRPLRFPVISKPSFGKGSEGVFKAGNVDELMHVIGKTLSSTKGCRALVEPYVNGPEIDVNLVLYNGRLIYSEVVDDFPSVTELECGSVDVLFTETQTAVPSKLPANEQNTIIGAMVETVRKMGFQTGILHCEARVRDSSMQYVLSPGCTIPDLEPTATLDTTEEPLMFLHEVNARMPGIMSSASSLIAEGIDFWALQILCAVSDWSRYEGLATSFLPDVMRNHVCLTNVLVDVSPRLIKEIFTDRPLEQLNWVMVTGDYDPMPELMRRDGEAMKYVAQHNALVKPAYTFGGSQDRWIWADTAVICSPLSRKHALDVADIFGREYEVVVKEKDQHAEVSEETTISSLVHTQI